MYSGRTENIISEEEKNSLLNLYDILIDVIKKKKNRQEKKAGFHLTQLN